MDDGIPPFLTVEEAGRLLRIGRTKAYDLTKEWRATGGRSGLPVVDLGDVLRVPGPALRQMLGTGLASAAPVAAEASNPQSETSPARKATTGSMTPSATPPSAPRARRRRPQPTSQLPLFEARTPNHSQNPNPRTSNP